MKLPVQITFRDVADSPSIKTLILNEAERLDRYFDRIMGCRVLVETPHRHQHKGKLYHLRIDLTVPGKEITVTRDPAAHGAHSDVYVAIRDAFKEMRRQLQDYVRARRGQIKQHQPEAHGRIRRLLPGENCGFLETKDGREIYFHENSVLNRAYTRLKEGDEVRFVEERGDDGPQASTVVLVGEEGRHDFPHRRAPAA